MRLFLPEIEGTLPIRSPVERFLDGFRQRVTAGLLTGQSHPRSNYVVTEAGSRRLVIRAVDWLTAFNVGLNDVALSLERPGLIRYHVRYWRWALYALLLSGTIGVVGLGLLLGTDVRAYFERNPRSMAPGLSIEQHVVIAWVMALFWGFVWPWLLIAMHKRPLRLLIARLIAEVDAAVESSPPR